jgi:hypothetical protein
MTWNLAWAASVAALIAVGGAAQAQAAPAKAERSCFYAKNVSGFRASDDKTVYLRVGVKDVYRLDLMGPCPDVNWNESIALVSRGSSFICTGLDAEVVSHSPIGPQRCPVQTLRKLTPAETQALPKGSRP